MYDLEFYAEDDLVTKMHGLTTIQLTQLIDGAAQVLAERNNNPSNWIIAVGGGAMITNPPAHANIYCAGGGAKVIYNA